MASLELRKDTYHVVFRFRGVKYTRSLKTSDSTTALGWKANVEETLRDIRRGRLPEPSENADIPGYIVSGGQLSEIPEKVETVPDPITLSQLFRDYFDALPEGSREESTLHGMRIHRDHLCRILGEKYQVQSLSLCDLQQYVATRSKDKGRRG